MQDITLTSNKIATMSLEEIQKVCLLEEEVGKLPQIELEVSQILHGGVYARTILIPAGVLVVGAMIKIATVLIIQGDALVYVDDKAIELHGYNMFEASEHRKQALLAKSDCYATMLFASNAKTKEEAEEEFTDEWRKLTTRKMNCGCLLEVEQCLA